MSVASVPCGLPVVCEWSYAVFPLSPLYAVVDVSPSASDDDISAYTEPLRLYTIFVSNAIYILPVSQAIGNDARSAYSKTSSTYAGSCDDGTLPLLSNSAYQLFAHFSLFNWYQLKS